MKKTILLAIVCAGFTAPLLADNTNVLSDEKSRVSYAIGLRIGTGWKQNGIDVDNTLVLRGLQDAQSGAVPLLTDEEVKNTLTQFQKTMQAKAMALRAEAGLKNKAEGEAFLTTNKNNPGVITLPDGLQYKVLTTGNGPTPDVSSTVTVNYRGTFINGTEFDSSAKTGHPVTFPVTGVIKGWTEALQKMNVGSKWQLYVPANLAYGEQGNRAIPGNSVLIFDVELLSIQAPKAPPVSPAVQNPPLTSDIIKVPSAAEMNKGAKIEVIKQEDVQKAQAASQGSTNTP
jgi:FKBP-type peptidyl-prolyl cis-trans isomerase